MGFYTYAAIGAALVVAQFTIGRRPPEDALFVFLAFGVFWPIGVAIGAALALGTAIFYLLGALAIGIALSADWLARVVQRAVLRAASWAERKILDAFERRVT